jgi:LysM repeat protein
MDPRRRQELTRYGAPAAFLAAVTIAVILVKAGLNGGSGTTTASLFPTTSTTATTTATTTKLVLTPPQASTATTTDTTTPGAEYYVVQSGDTLGSIAQTYTTTVDDLMTLNPGIDPTGLHIGDKIRVK